jgi:hypothetical protein
VQWIARNLDPSRIRLYVHGSMGPWTEYLLPRFRQTYVEDDFKAESIGDPRDAWLIAEGATAFEEGVNFRRRHGRLWNIARHRFFEISVRPLASAVTFGDGWYGEESSDVEVWRWMGRRSVTRLAALEGGGDLHLGLYVPLDGLRKPPVVTISANGSVLERFTATEAIVERNYSMSAGGTRAVELVLETDQVVRPEGDPRELGLRLQRLTWRAR